MVMASMFQAQPLLFLPTFSANDLVWLLLGGVCAFLVSYGLVFAIIRLYRKFGWVRPVEPGRTPDRTPRLGGVGIYLAFVLISFLFYLPRSELNFCSSDNCERTSYWLFLLGATLIVAVHAYDDLKPLKPWPKLLAQTLGVLIIMGPFFNGRFNGVLLFGFSNPFQAAVQHPGLPWYEQNIISLFIHSPTITLLAIPAVIFTWFWMVGMMNAVNWIDGVDGLAGGVVAITGVCMTIICWSLHQYTIAILSAIFTGAVVGFLPHNWNPAKIFMGDSGAHFLGLGLATLSIIGGAKVALALMVMGIPILNVAMVIISRVRRHQSAMQYDATHLHDRLRATGLSARQICYVFYSFTAIFGVLALWFVHLYKLLGIGLVVATMVVLVLWLDYRQQRGKGPARPAERPSEEKRLPDLPETEGPQSYIRPIVSQNAQPPSHQISIRSDG
ncbi:MAG TPA: MraY family glycosyltransferase [Ktedonobacteraceae bacterium]|nr:MraY family glycosyltransferase [Ktedonobacteraceae bacterium]